MKVLSLHDSKAEDRLRLTFDGAFDPRVAWESELEPFFLALEKYADGWMPDVVKGKRQRKYARSAIWKSLEEERQERRTAIGFYRTKWPALDMTLRLWSPPLPPELGLTVNVKPLACFAEVERCQKFVE
ncbi:MAG TPA: hypothetical protein VF794_26410, partial [Archangium sp.]